MANTRKQTNEEQAVKQQGVRLISLDIIFSAEAEPERWRKLVTHVGMAPASRVSNADESSFSGSFAALPDPIDDDSLYLLGDFHSLSLPKGKAPNAHWHLEWVKTPSTKPPKSLKEASKQVGGYPEVLARIVAAWPTNIDVKATVRASYAVDPAMFPSIPLPIKRRPKPTRIKTSAGERRLKQSLSMKVWDVDPPVGDVNIVSAIMTKEVLNLHGSGSFKLKLSPIMEQGVSEKIWNSIKSLLAGTV